MKHSPPTAKSVASRRLLLIIGFALLVSACKMPRTGPPTVQYQVDSAKSSQRYLLNINSASPEEFENLPGIGKVIALRIIAHRQRYGPFRRVEHLLIVRGISDRKFRAIQPLIVAE